MNQKPQTSSRRLTIGCAGLRNSSRRSQRHPECHASAGGFTLIELMVAMTIGLLLMTGLVTLYSNISNTNNEMAKTNGLIENGRFAIQLLQNDITHAGFWGTYAPPFDDLTSISPAGDSVPASSPTVLLVPGTPRDVPDPCLAYSSANWTARYRDNLIGIPVQSYDALPASCTAAAPAPALANQLAGTDVLVVRHADTCVAGVGTCAADTAGVLYFQSSLCEAEIGGIPPSRYLLLTDAPPPAPPPPPTVFTLKNMNCVATAEKRKFISTIYYIRNFSTTAGDGIPTLVRSQFDFDPAGGTLMHQAVVPFYVPLIEGIERFRVELGVDERSETGVLVDDTAYSSPVVWQDPNNMKTPTNRGDGVPESYVHCTTAIPCTVAQLRNVVAVKLYLLVRNVATTPGYTDSKTYTLGSAPTIAAFSDNYKRHVFSTTVRLTNISGRRETPP